MARRSRRIVRSPLALIGGITGMLMSVAVGLASAGDEVITVTQEPTPIQSSELVGNVGAMLTLPVNGLLLANATFDVEDVPGQLLFSDNPEYVTGEGVAYRGDASGRVRVYVYHANADAQEKYILAWLINHGDEPVTVQVAREALGGPGVGYGYIGQSVLKEYFGPQTARTMVVPPHGRELIDPRLAQAGARQWGLVHGIYDLVIDGTVEIAITGSNDPTVDPSLLPDLPPRNEGAGRGMFFVSERHVTFTAGDVPTGILIASGRGNDPWVDGFDQVYGVPDQLVGNYGVVYHIDAELRTSRPMRVRFFMAPGFDGGGRCPMAPSIRIGTTAHTHFGEAEDGYVVRVPHDGARTMGYPNMAAFLGEIVIEPDRPRLLRLDFMPPGGSCLPAALIVWPAEMDGYLPLPIKGLDRLLQP